MRIDLKNKTALVCGSTQGIGKAIAMQLADAGAVVILVARNLEKLEAVINELPTPAGQKHGYLQADFSQPAQLEKALSKFCSEQPEIHILINNTGGPAAGLAIDSDTSQFLSAFNNHLICNHILAKAVVPKMEKAGYGRIINIISTSVKQPLKGLGVSNTIRGAVANWSKTLATELASRQITVNNILPGATKTERLSSIITNKSEKVGKPDAEIEKEMLAEIPAGRFGQPEEIAYAAVFLASPQAAYINGTNVVVDGGRTSSL